MRVLAAAALALATAHSFPLTPSGRFDAPPRCTRYADPSGDDSAHGTAAAPFRTVARLADSLRAGETGCVRTGVYREEITMRRGGTRAGRVTLAAAPGARPILIGRLVIAETATDVTISGLRLDGRNARRLPSPTVNGDRIHFVGNDVTNRRTAICFAIGSNVRRAMAEDLVVRGNRIHHCGRLPPTNHEHGLYLERTDRARITDNVIYANADRGIQLYPNAQRTLVFRNVIDGNGVGVIISGDHGYASNRNRIVGNVISNSRVRHNVESWWPRGNPVGRGNVVMDNCVWNGKYGDIGEEQGFVARANVTADPLYVDRARGDFRLRARSPCARRAPVVSG